MARCGKFCYPSVGLARAAAARQIKQGRALRPYRCGACKAFHLTSGARRKPRQNR